jgi:hypothetical protein
MAHPLTESEVQAGVSDAMENFRSVSPTADPEMAQPPPDLDDQEEDRRFQDYDDDDGHVGDLYGEEERGEDSYDQLLPGDDMGGNEERYIDEVEELEFERLEALSSIIHPLKAC